MDTEPEFNNVFVQHGRWTFSIAQHREGDNIHTQEIANVQLVNAGVDAIIRYDGTPKGLIYALEECMRLTDEVEEVVGKERVH
jgi:hypothetical protein